MTVALLCCNTPLGQRMQRRRKNAGLSALNRLCRVRYAKAAATPGASVSPGAPQHKQQPLQQMVHPYSTVQGSLKRWRCRCQPGCVAAECLWCDCKLPVRQVQTAMCQRMQCVRADPAA